MRRSARAKITPARRVYLNTFPLAAVRWLGSERRGVAATSTRPIRFAMTELFQETRRDETSRVA